MEGGGEEWLVCGRGMSRQADPAAVDFGQRYEVIDGARSRPGPTRKTGEIVLRINLNEPVGIVLGPAKDWVVSSIEATDIAAPHGGVEPRKVSAMVGQEYRSRTFAFR